jgi:hypothetical protein
MPTQEGYDENSWRLSRIRQLWSELRTTRPETPRHYELVARIRAEAEAYNRGMSAGQHASPHLERRTEGHHA